MREFVEKTIAVRNATTSRVDVKIAARHREARNGAFEWQWVSPGTGGSSRFNASINPGEVKTFLYDGGTAADDLGKQATLLSGAEIQLTAESARGEQWSYDQSIFVVETVRSSWPPTTGRSSTRRCNACGSSATGA